MTEIFGTPDNDLLLGTDENNIIFGLEGDDTIYGGQGDDTIFGNQGDDVIFGNEGNDILYGGKGNDLMYGDEGDNLMFGNLENDLLVGGPGEDTLYGGQGDDNLFGGAGNDFLSGDKGNDFLVGVDITSSTPGLGEIDTLSGGSGFNLFVLGDENQSYYIGGGNEDYALITDFSPTQDQISVHGNSEIQFVDFTFGELGEGVGIVADNDLIAFLQGVTAEQLEFDVNVLRAF